MAITIDKRAPLHTMVYNPAFWVVRSTNTAQANFRFVMDVYITGQTFAGQNYIRLKVPTDPVQNKGVFEPNAILERYLTYDLDIAAAGTEAIKQADGSVIQYQLKFGEEYGPSSAVVVTPDLAVSALSYAYNGCIDPLDYIDFINTSGAIYLNPATTTKRFLTNDPRKATSPYCQVRSSENCWLQILNDQNTVGNSSSRAHYEFYDSTFTVLNATVIINNNFRLLSNIADRRLIVPTGYNIDQIASADIISGTLPQVSSASNVFWKVWMTDTANTQTSEIFIFQKDSSCATSDVYRLHFMNEHGAFDSFSFTKAHKFETDIKERKKYMKPLGKFIAANNYMYEATDQQDVIFYTELKDTITIHSDWISESISKWLEELVTSPTVFVENVTWSSTTSNITLVPVSLTLEKKYERKQRATDKLFDLQIKMQPTYNRYRQRA